MKGGSDSSAMEAMIQATIKAEKSRECSKVSVAWQATLDDMIVKPTWIEKDAPFFGKPYQKSLNKGEATSKEVWTNEQALHYRKSRNLVKIASPPRVISLDSSFLSERIDSLQNLALVGKWHFPEMDNADMRKCLNDRWKPLICYTPIISRLMKEWYCFHFLKVSDLEVVFNKPWVHGRSFLYLFRWYIGFDPLKNNHQIILFV